MDVSQSDSDEEFAKLMCAEDFAVIEDSLDAKTPILNRRRDRQLYRWIFKPF